jgi:hypothetical protein
VKGILRRAIAKFTMADSQHVVDRMMGGERRSYGVSSDHKESPKSKYANIYQDSKREDNGKWE